ncbi:hypothetical protein HanRHA438_Chr15g0718051 [Helianthus annuus]|nr:hypothetical protein HanIR_Chr15g0767671 [Helianthus annuus]KAJ0845829.1 hypothetical protein HanRHA438_Chr15g0718051 [Helianthus annuus]
MVLEFGPECLASPRLAWLLNQGCGVLPCEDHLNSASATASGTEALKCPRRDLVENPSPTVVAAAYGNHSGVYIFVFCF